MDSDSADESDVGEPEEEEPAPDAPTQGKQTPHIIHWLPPKLIPSTRSVQHTSSELVMIPMDILPQSVAWPSSSEEQQQKSSRELHMCILGREQSSHCSVALFVKGWLPHLYMLAPPLALSQTALEALQMQLEEKLDTLLELRSIRKNGPSHQAKRSKRQLIVSMDLVEGRRSIYGYRSQPSRLYKITVTAPYLVHALRDCLEGYEWEEPREDCQLCQRGDFESSEDEQAHKRKCEVKVSKPGLKVVCQGGRVLLQEGRTETFNSNIDCALQFMCDSHGMGCQLLKVTGCEQVDYNKISSCDIEVTACYSDLEWLDMEKHMGMGEIRTLSFDLEAAGRRGVFPQPSEDPVIQIACSFAIGQALVPQRPVLLSLHLCDDIDDANVLSFEREEDLLLAFAEIVYEFDPDVLTGYNIVNFDLEYLFKRAQALGVADKFNSVLSRLPQTAPLTVRETFFQSAQMGKRKRNSVQLAGRFILDVFVYLTNDTTYRLDSYTLNSVSAFFLGDNKVDLPFTQITPLWKHGGPEGRKQLGVYCLKDAQLPIQLMQKLHIVLNTIEMSRAVGIVPNWVLSRGLMVRFMSLLIREASARDFVLPYIKQGSVSYKSKYTGATVLDSIPGIHEHVAVLDFSSMYPSILISHNICFCTFLMDDCPSSTKMEPFEVNCGKNSVYRFVREQEQQGVVPSIVAKLLHNRKVAKKAMEAAKDPMEAVVQDARQKSFKVSANGIYGALGSSLSKLPFRQGAESVTCIGRNDIALVKSLAEDTFTRAKGYSRDATCVAGDTDSVMIAMPVETTPDDRDCVAEAIRLAKLLEAAVNLKMKAPKSIAFEKVFRRMVILKKKKYCGLKYDSAEKPPKIDMKGVEAVRRDGCSLIRTLMKEVLDCLAWRGDIAEAASMVRRAVLQVMQDQLPVESYVISKVLRKSIQDCSAPMTQREIAAVRERIGSKSAGAELSYAEQDEAILKKVRLPWKLLRRLPHVMLAYRQRLRDPGSAPVLGERIQFVVTNNAGKALFEKVETLHDVQTKHLPVDRVYYIEAMQTPFNGIFGPLVGTDQLHGLLWKDTKSQRMQIDKEKKKQMLEASPLVQMFKKQKQQ